MQIEEKLLELVYMYTEKERKSCCNEDLNLLDDLEYDSLSFMQLIISIENQFGIEFSNEYLDISIMLRFSDLLRIVQEMVEK